MRASIALLLLATVAVAGCSASDEPAAAADGTAGGGADWKIAPPVSGSRLRARFTTGGGARQLVGFHDAERNEDCTFQPAEDGRRRCLPASATSVQAGFFADAACAIPLASVPACSTEVKIAISSRYDDGNCRQTPGEIRTVLGGAKTVYARGPNGCAPQLGSPGSAQLFALGDVVPWTAFVEGVETIIPGDPVAEKVLLTGDGARQHLGFWIEKLDVECTFQVMPDGITRCVPAASSGPVIYTDSQCTKASFVNDYISSGRCSSEKRAPNLWLEPSLGTCQGARAVYSLRASYGGDVAPYDPSSLYSTTLTSPGSGSSAVTCSSMYSGSGGQSSARRAIDADVTASLPTTRRVGDGEGRLVPALVSSSAPAAGAGASPALTVAWHDKERDTDCTFARASDGKLRCLPTGPAATIFHTDAACKSTSLVAVPNERPCIASRFARVVTATCPVTTRVYALGAERRNLTSASTDTAPGRCAALQGVNSAADATEIDPAELVEGVPAAD